MPNLSVVFKKKYVELEVTRGVDAALSALCRDIGSNYGVTLESIGSKKWSWSSFSFYRHQRAFIEDVSAGDGDCVQASIYGIGGTQQEAKAELLSRLLNPSLSLAGSSEYRPQDRLLIGRLTDAMMKKHRGEARVINDIPAP